MPPWSRSERIVVGVALLIVGLTLRPNIDFDRGDFPIFLQTRSFAHFRMDIAIPEGAEPIKAAMSVKDGRYYAHYPQGTSLLLVPFYWAGRAIDVSLSLPPRERGGWTVGQFAFLFTHVANLVFLGGILILLRRLGVLLGLPAPARACAALLLVFAAPFWNLASHLGSHLPSTLCVLGATVFAFEGRPPSTGKLAVAGVFAGLALLIRNTNAVPLLPLAIYLLWVFRGRVTGTLAFALPAGTFGVLVLFLNAGMFGNPLDTPYQHSIQWGRDAEWKPVLTTLGTSFRMPLGQGLLGLTVGAVSPDRPDGILRPAQLPTPMLPWDQVRGLLLLMPIAVFGIPGLLRLRTEGRGPEVALIAAQFFLLLVFHAKYLFWYANGHTPLPSRFLCEAFPGWCAAVAAYGYAVTGPFKETWRFAAIWSVGSQTIVVGSIYVNFMTGWNFVAQPTWIVFTVLLVASVLVRQIARSLKIPSNAENPVGQE